MEMRSRRLKYKEQSDCISADLWEVLTYMFIPGMGPPMELGGGLIPP